ncbi:MAG: hypothetical protein ACLUEQ_06030 [Cloacibacillus evryensis]
MISPRGDNPTRLRKPQYRRLAAYGHMGRVDLDPMPAWSTDKAETLKRAAERFA